MTLQPYMPQNEIAMLDAVLALKRPRHVLEFGAGGSTVRWHQSPYVQSWYTIEHDAEWVARVKAEAPHAGIDLVSDTSFTDYIAPVLYATEVEGTRYDLILVDGRYRVRCVQASPDWLAEDGVMVLHDAGRVKYAAAWDVYPHKAMLTKGDATRDGLMVLWGDV